MFSFEFYRSKLKLSNSSNLFNPVESSYKCAYTLADCVSAVAALVVGESDLPDTVQGHYF